MSTVLVLSPGEPTGYGKMPQGLSGYWWETAHFVCVPWIASSDPKAFLSFLRGLERKGKTVFFPTVINARLDRLLRLRGYQDAVVPDPCKGGCQCELMGESVFGLAKMCS